MEDLRKSVQQDTAQYILEHSSGGGSWRRICTMVAHGHDISSNNKKPE